MVGVEGAEKIPCPVKHFWEGEKKNNGTGVVVGLSPFIPPIAKARWMGHPGVCKLEKNRKQRGGWDGVEVEKRISPLCSSQST